MTIKFEPRKQRDPDDDTPLTTEELHAEQVHKYVF